jgi:hypothetical protein
MNIKAITMSALLAFGAMGTAASAATLFDVTDNPGGQVLPDEIGIADGGTYSSGLTSFDSVSVGVRASTGSTSGVIGFTFSPTPLFTTLDIALSGIDFGIFGVTGIHLATNSDGTGVFASETVNGAGVYSFFNNLANSPLYVVFDWTNDVTGSFDADISLAPIPVPAAGFLLLGGLGGLAAMRRKKKASA